VTNLEAAPPEVVCAATTSGVEVLTPRDVPLGGPRAMTVRRTLPQRARSFIGAFCFADHYGPDDVAVTGGMVVPPHPHTGLQTVSWLFSGELEHRDSLGTHALVRPGEMNLMTAGRGIAHSETSTPATTVLHGVQLWTLLPAAARDAAPAFDHHVPPVVEPPGAPGVRLRVFLGSLAGATSPVRTFSPLVGAEVRVPAGGAVELDLDPTFEHGFLVDTGRLEVAGRVVLPGELGYVPPGVSPVRLVAHAGEDLRLLLVGGEPLGERVVMWWNFVGTDHDEVAAARAQWQAELAGGPADRFGAVPGYPGDPLPAPVLPGTRLLPRG
jgi:quercetin 2,3-dioxygenase